MSLPVSPPASPPREVLVDPDALARAATAGAGAPVAAARLAAAAHDLAAALSLALPATSERPAGGRSAPLARALAEHWTRDARTWADAVTTHAERVAGVATAFVALDGGHR